MGIGVEPPSRSEAPDITRSSLAVSMENTVKDTVKSRRIAILASEGFNSHELMQVREALKKAGAHCTVVSMYLGTLRSADGQQIEVDKNYVSTASVLFDALYIPGGRQSVDALKTHGEAIHFVNETFKHNKPIAAVNEGVELLETSSIQGVSLAERGSPGMISSDEGVVTVWGKPDMSGFVRTFIDAVARHRHWQREEKKLVPA
jgi:catalase